jgi:hypothetical protein
MNQSESYRVETVETAAPPRGAPDGEWCRYVVASPSSRIVGRFRGSLPQARRNAEHLVKGLNSRLSSGKSPWTPRSQQRTAKRASKAARKRG